VGALAAGTNAFRILKLADGAIVDEPTYCLIGEEGAEVVVPLTPSGAGAGAARGVGAGRDRFAGLIGRPRSSVVAA
jgi:hypothetical protein